MGEAMFVKQRIAIVEWAEDHEYLFDDRAVIVLALYFLGAIIVGVAAWKAVVMARLPMGSYLCGLDLDRSPFLACCFS
jgi:hypothetical protein